MTKLRFLSSDVYNTVTSLPRPPEDSALVTVEYKKALRFQGHYLKTRMRPNFCRKAVIKLKEIGNKHYQDIEIADEVPEITETNETESQNDNENNISDDEMEAPEGPDEDRGQTLRDHKTCLTLLDPELEEAAKRRREDKEIEEPTI